MMFTTLYSLRNSNTRQTLRNPDLKILYGCTGFRMLPTQAGAPENQGRNSNLPATSSCLQILQISPNSIIYATMCQH